METSMRRASQDDVAVLSLLNVDVQRLHADALPHLFKQPSDLTFPVATVTELMADPSNVFFLAEVDGTAVGYLWAEIRRRPEDGAQYARNSIMIHHISVMPAHQQRGHGQQLMAAVKQLAKDEGITSVVLDTHAFNRAAQSFFASQGFIVFNYRLGLEVAP